MIFILIIGLVGNSYGEQNNTNFSNWFIHPIVGKYLSSDPPKPDQIFNFKYRIANGTINKFTELDQSSFKVTIDSSRNGIFEIKIPRNYPYSNVIGNIETRHESFFVIINKEDMTEKIHAQKNDECFFSYSIPFSGNSEIELGFGVYPAGLPYYGDDVPKFCLNKTIIHDPPLKQIRSGIAPKDVICNEDLFLVTKTSNGEPVCVTQETQTILVQRGWGKTTVTWI